MKVLLVEDEEPVRKLVNEILLINYPDLTTVEATGYTSAMSHIVAQDFDLVLTDLESKDPQDHGKTGLHTIEEIQRIKYGTPCILMTGNPTHADALEMQKRWPGIPVLGKPIEIPKLLLTLAEELAKAQKP